MGLGEMSSLEQVEFELSDGAQTDCPGGDWLFQPVPHGQRLDGPVMFAVDEIQGGVEAIDGVGSGRPRRAWAQARRGQEGTVGEKEIGRALCWRGEGRGEGLVKEGGREWCQVRCSTKCSREEH